jgi:anthranilate synthase/aminodeoxychorismate synthase-like glutamine amidotransferase
MPNILIIDNYDSFTYNLKQLFAQCYDGGIIVKRNDEITIDHISRMAPEAVIISPGPGTPADAGISCRVIEYFFTKVPILGVCLGMQCINEVFHGSTVKAPRPVHGKVSKITGLRGRLFENIDSDFTAARYHSLVIEPRPAPLKVTAKTEDGIIMAVEHPDYPLFGVQFHPESFLTGCGSVIARNFLRCL